MMRDVIEMAAFVIVAQEVRKMGYSPGYLKAVLEADDSEMDRILDILHDLGMVYRKATFDIFGKHTGYEICWDED